MKYRCTAAVLLAVAAFVRAESTTIKVDDAAALAAAPKDTEVTVEGKVAKAEWSKSGKVCSIEFEGDPKIMVVAFEKSKTKFDEAFGGDFTKQFAGAVVRFNGKLADYGGKAKKYEGYKQIILSQTGQVTVMTPAATQPTTAPAAE